MSGENSRVAADKPGLTSHGLDESAQADLPPDLKERSAPISVAVGAAVGLLLAASTTLRIRDVDLFWHLRAGREILGGTSPSDIGSSWAFAPDPMPWVSTQWLAEVVLHEIQSVGSWSGLIVYRTLTAALTVAVLAYTTLRGRPVALAAFPFVIAAAAAISVSQERPNQATLIGAAALGSVLVSGMTKARLPRWWVILPVTWIWANYHGGWVLVPGTLGLICVSRLLDHGLRDDVAIKALGLSLASLVAGTLTPAGTASTLAILRFSNATDAIQEWQRTSPLTGHGMLTVAMLGVIATGWAKSTVPRSEAVATAALMLFSWAAIRNVAPAMLILAPMAANRLCVAFPRIGRAPEPRWSAPAGISIASACLIISLASIPGQNHLPVDRYPVKLAADIRDLPGAQRVLNDYNVAGFVLHFADADDQVGIDGRSDRYGAHYIESYLDLTNLRGDWEPLLAELEPTAALLDSDRALAHVLVAERGWVVVAEQGGWVLLEDPRAVR